MIADNKFRAMSFAYDANGRQVKASKASSPDAWTVYDALGNRVATKINDIWQYVVYDAFGKLVAEYGLASEGAGGVKYIQQDWQGSVRTVTNNNGFVVARTDYTAFGEEIGFGTGLRSIEQGYGADSSTRQGYGLTEKDAATGLNHAWFRKNETQAGRWTSPDPYKGSMSVGNPQSFNRYSYVNNQPTNFVDPSGLMCTYVVVTVYDEDGTTIIDRWVDFGDDCFDFPGPPSGGGGGGNGPWWSSTGGGGGGGGGPIAGIRSADPNGDECRQLVGTINNLRKKIAEKTTELLTNPFGLPDQPPFFGAPDKLSQQGHRDLLGKYQDDLDRAREKYRKRCGGDPPSSNPARVPVPVPMPAPTPSRDSQRRRDAQGIPVGVKVAAGVGTGVVIYVVGKKLVGAGLLFTPAAPAGIVLIATP